MDTNLSEKTFSFNNEGDNPYFRIVIKVKKFISVNHMHQISKQGASGRHLYDTEETIKQKNDIKEQIAMSDPIKYCKEWLNWKTPLYFSAIYLIREKFFFKRDTDNFQKVTQDGIFESLGINDSHCIQVDIKKAKLPDSSPYEYAIIEIGRTNFDYNQYVQQH